MKEVHVTFDEYLAASLAEPELKEQTVLMKLFEKKGIRMKNDAWEPAPPMELKVDKANNRFVVRQWGEKK